MLEYGPNIYCAYQAIVTTPVGKVGIIVSDHHLLGMHYLKTTADTQQPTTRLAKKVVEQLYRYFADPHFIFNLPCFAELTTFQVTVANALRAIPPSKTCTYGKLAKQLDTHPRTIGTACRKNPIPIIIPCHRVVASRSLGGYYGRVNPALLAIKRWLLEHEGYTGPNNRSTRPT